MGRDLVITWDYFEKNTEYILKKSHIHKPTQEALRFLKELDYSRYVKIINKYAKGGRVSK